MFTVELQPKKGALTGPNRMIGVINPDGHNIYVTFMSRKYQPSREVLQIDIYMQMEDGSVGSKIKSIEV